MIDTAIEWFRMANKYLENLYSIDTSKYGYVTVKRDIKDDGFSKEFDFISSQISQRSGVSL